MIEVKFRGKRVDNGEWVYGHLLYNLWGHFIVDHFMLHNKDIEVHGYIEVVPETIGQFTGRCDTEGNELYEGDSIGHINNVIGWSGDCFCVNGDRPLWQWLAYKKIGNIYDNIELTRHDKN